MHMPIDFNAEKYLRKQREQAGVFACAACDKEEQGQIDEGTLQAPKGWYFHPRDRVVICSACYSSHSPDTVAGFVRQVDAE